MFREALEYTTRPPLGGRSVLVGGALVLVVGVCVAAAGFDVALAPLLLVAVVPWLLVGGYYVRVVRTTIGREEPLPPGFGGLRRLLGDGLKAVVVAALYLLPAVVVLGPLVYAASVEADLTTTIAGPGASSTLSAVLLSVLGVVATLALLYLLAAIYALPVAVASFAHAGRFRAAFDRRRVFDGALSEDYVVAWFVSLLLQGLLLPVAYLLRVLVVGFFVQFLVAVAVRYCYGQGVGAALDLDPVATDHPDVVEPSAVHRDDLKPAVRRIDESLHDW